MRSVDTNVLVRLLVRDDARFLKTTKARWTSDGPALSYEDVDIGMLKPRPRKYDVEKSATA